MIASWSNCERAAKRHRNLGVRWLRDRLMASRDGDSTVTEAFLRLPLEVIPHRALPQHDAELDSRSGILAVHVSFEQALQSNHALAEVG